MTNFIGSSQEIQPVADPVDLITVVPQNNPKKQYNTIGTKVSHLF